MNARDERWNGERTRRDERMAAKRGMDCEKRSNAGDFARRAIR